MGELRSARSGWLRLLGLPALLLMGNAPATTGRPRAQAIVDAIAREQGAPPRPLGADGDVSFGEFGARYDDASDILTVRVFIARASIGKTTPQGLANYRKVAAALNDPAIGSMFDRGGGDFVLDEDREMYFLKRRYTVASADPATVATAVEGMLDVAALWTTRWFFRVAMIVGGHQPPPDRRVTLADPGPAD